MRSKRVKSKQKARHRKKRKSYTGIKAWIHGTGIDKVIEI